MDWYLMAFKKFADFSSRSRRSEYWYFVLFNFLISLVLGFVDGFLGTYILSILYTVVIFIPSLAVGVRRLHDTTRSGWWMLIGLVPLIGFIVLIVFFAQDGHPGSNKWGRNPKEAETDVTDHLVT